MRYYNTVHEREGSGIIVFCSGCLNWQAWQEIVPYFTHTVVDCLLFSLFDWPACQGANTLFTYILCSGSFVWQAPRNFNLFKFYNIILQVCVMSHYIHTKSRADGEAINPIAIACVSWSSFTNTLYLAASTANIVL